MAFDHVKPTIFSDLSALSCGVYCSCVLPPVANVDYRVEPDGSVKAWTVEGATRNIPQLAGISCFIAMDALHDSAAVCSSSECCFIAMDALHDSAAVCGSSEDWFLLSEIPRGFLLLYDADLILRDGLLHVPHMLLFPTEAGMSPVEFEKRVRSAFRAPRCTHKVEEEVIRVPSSPWRNNDLDDVTNPEIRMLYIVAKHAYTRAPLGIKIVLDAIMMAIACHKLTVTDLQRREYAELRAWYRAIRSCGTYVEEGLLCKLGIAESVLEDALDISDETDHRCDSD